MTITREPRRAPFSSNDPERWSTAFDPHRMTTASCAASTPAAFSSSLTRSTTLGFSEESETHATSATSLEAKRGEASLAFAFAFASSFVRSS